MRPAQSVLIVEDSYLLLEIVASLCETHGIRVIEASTGEAALTVLRERGGAIDWLFTDIHLPGLIDGWTVAHAFRAIHPDRPVVYTSTDTHGRSGVSHMLIGSVAEKVIRNAPCPVLVVRNSGPAIASEVASTADSVGSALNA